MRWRNRRKIKAQQQAIQGSSKLIAPSLIPATIPPTAHYYGPTGATGVTTPHFSSFSSVSYPVSLTPAPTKPPLKDNGLAIEPIVGLRSYFIDVETELLLSHNQVSWPHREPLHALCNGDPFVDHDVPKDGCMCGIYAWNKDLVNAVTGPIYGEVYLWGDVLICPNGYRAEIAYPKNLKIKAPKTRAVTRLRDALEEAYGVPVTIVTSDEVEQVDVSGFGSSNPFLSS